MASDNRLIADSGSTTTSWCLIQDNQETHIETEGISPYFLKEKEIKKVLSETFLTRLPIPAVKISRIFFYGTGLGVPEKADLMKAILSEVFAEAVIEVNHDLIGAARALCGHNEGIACILGTGSGICYFDGQVIQKSSPGLGFILGDEGSGAYLGKMLIQRYLYGKLDKNLTTRFEDQYHPQKADILKKVYQEPFPNRYLASFAHFLSENRKNASASEIIEQGINDFILQHVRNYQQNRLPVHFAGGIAKAFDDVVIKLCNRHGFQTGRILEEPIDGLIRFHQD